MRLPADAPPEETPEETPAVRPLPELRARLAGLGRWPDGRAWLETLLLGGLLALLLTPLALASNWLPGPFEPRPGTLLRLLLVPALLEEALFRGLFNPPPDRPAPGGRAQRLRWAALSLTVYVVAHPLSAWLWRPAAREVFWAPAFWLATALLGAACLGSYLRSGSLWPALALHWSVVALWAAFGGLTLL